MKSQSFVPKIGEDVSAALPSVRRREFLIGGSALLLNCLAPAALAANPASIVGVTPSVGYWNPEAVPVTPAANAAIAPFRADVQAAQRLPGGDTLLAETGVQITIHGLYGQETLRDARLSINAHFPVNDNDVLKTVSFHAWSAANRAGASTGGSIRFVMPVDARNGILLSLEHQSGAQMPSASRSVADAVVQAGSMEVGPTVPMSEDFYRFVITGESGLPRLRRGVYFLPVGSAAASAPPNWNALQFRAMTADGKITARQLAGMGARGIAPVTFDYFLISVDAAPILEPEG